MKRFVLFQTALLLIGVGALVIGLFVLPIRALLYGWPTVEQTRECVHRSAKFYISLLEKWDLIVVDIQDFDKVPSDSGAILVANHPSLLDIVFFLSLFPSCGCVAKRDLARFSPYALVIRWAKYVSASGGQEIVEEANQELAQGKKFAIFPEGTRRDHNNGSEELKFKRGAAALALRSGAPVVPVVFHYSPIVLGRNRKWYDAPKETCSIKIRFFEPIKFNSTNSERWLQRREVTEKLEDFFKNNT